MFSQCRQCNAVFINIDANNRFCRRLCTHFGSFVRDGDVQFFAPVSDKCLGSTNVPVVVFHRLCEQVELVLRAAKLAFDVVVRLR
jgi:hypothetical protein